MKSLVVVLLFVCLIALSFAEAAKDAKATKGAHDEHHDTKDAKDDHDDHSHGHKPYERHTSDREHHDDDDELHDPAFDHDAFLGKEDADKFAHLTPEESTQRLGELIDKKVDLDKDGKVTPSELKLWLSKVSSKSMAGAIKSRFMNMKAEIEAKDLRAPFTWDQYYQWKFVHEGKEPPKPGDKTKVDKEFEEGLARDKKKWKAADKDGDGNLNLEEFVAFVHPEEVPRMRDIVIEETLHEMDADKDGYISLKEYLQDQYHDYSSDIANKKKLPEWVEKEKQEFQTKFDKDKDGKLSPAEVYRWIVPDDFDRSIKEAKHLIEKADENKDGVLTKEEILKNHDLFAGSQATDFGSALNRHEEL